MTEAEEFLAFLRAEYKRSSSLGLVKMSQPSYFLSDFRDV